MGTIRTATNLFWNRQTPNPCQYLRPDSRNDHGNDPAAVKIEILHRVGWVEE
ncbi:hypothetical protein PLAN_30411 [Planktothrix rubescens CCAP 1459/22]|uniref:Uncharacterized protein n=1 Tax=Planktothrix rubescens CCAP 1459/22 TaxID=329571 RepID=A0A6J7ZMJ2_PLARU|nr:hypothetical protein PLAN_30411 [Planktothrix rubescens NIVA-CYA 18]